MPKDTLSLPLQGRAASLRPASVNLEARTVEICWTTGAVVARAAYDYYDDEVVEYDEELVVDAASLRLERLQLGAPFLDSHSGYRLTSVLGSVVPGSVRLEDGKGYATIQLTNAEDAKGQVERILEGTVRNVSVGYRVHRFEVTKEPGKRDLWRAVDWEPMEISAVAIPADPLAQTRSDDVRATATPCLLVRAQDHRPAGAFQEEAAMPKPNQADEQNAARDDDAQQARGQGGSTAPATGAGAPSNAPGDAPAGGEGQGGSQAPAPVQPTETRGHADVATAAQRAVADERTRTSAISALCRRHGLDGDFSQDLIERGVSIAAAREAVLDHLADADPLQGRSHEPARPRDDGSRGAAYRSAMETALLHRVNPGSELTDAAREFRGMTLRELARHSLERAGTSTRGMSSMEIATAALGQRAVGYHTTGDFPQILANLGNRTMRAAYAVRPQTFAAWARRASLSDFRPTTRVQISGAPRLEKVLEGAEFQYGTFGEASQQYALATYGKIIAFSRQMLINDDLGAFTRVSNGFGARARQLEGDIVYEIFRSNPVMADGFRLFSAEHGNLGTPAGITEESLTEAMDMFADVVDIDGSEVDVQPEYLLTGHSNRVLEARRLFTQTTPSATADVNVFANAGLSVVEERRLRVLDGRAPWFLAASNALMDTIEYAYLDGEDGIFTETRNGFEVDGVEIKARLDFAAAAIDWRGLFKNPGLPIA